MAAGFKCCHATMCRDIPAARRHQYEEQAMYHQQRDFIQLAENPTEPPADITVGPAATRKSFFAAFLDALHDSRRLKAERVIRQYRHLITAVPARTVTPG
jgi:hypothetical protein